MQQLKFKIRTLGTGQVAWLLGTDTKTINRWADAGILKAWRTTCRGDKRFRRVEIANLLARLGA